MNNGQTYAHVPDAVLMPKRERIKLERVSGDVNRVTDEGALVVWFDSRAMSSEAELRAMLPRLVTAAYTGVVFYPDNVEQLSPLVSSQAKLVLHVDSRAELDATLDKVAGLASRENLVISTSDPQLLEAVKAEGRATCMRAYVDDGESLHEAIRMGAGAAFLMIKFRDPTNIPLELVIASLQATRTVLIKELSSADDIDDAVVTLGVMEVGADGVMFSPTSHDVLDAFSSRIQSLESNKALNLQVGTVVRTQPIGIGYRSCIDLATIFAPTEGMIVGSTSQGGILCCPEVFFLPYMELRPFRVNAGAVHSYVYNVGDRTDYMTELRAGSSVMIVDSNGKTRKAPVGRMKTEMRPLRLIEVEFPGGERVNVIMQDDWHVRVFSADAKPLNITELKAGDKVLGHVAAPGRHVGIKVDEHIIET